MVMLLLPGAALASEGGHVIPPAWAVLPFIVLLGMIATGPLFYHHFWERYYPHVSIALGLVVVLFYAIALKSLAPIYHSLMEYISFIALLASLFVASGAILIEIDKKGTPLLNVVLLFIGCIVSNFIGTTGASMLLIRPFMRVNRGRIRAYHVIFFIFLVSNIGGALTPIGDPPLFMGFLRGVGFFWVVQHIWHIWLLTVIMVLAVFFVIDTLDIRKSTELEVEHSGQVRLMGVKSFVWLFIIIGAVFLDPNVIEGFPSLKEMYHVPFGIRELIMFTICFLAYKTASKEALRGNDFNFEPIKEVAYLFIGIFMTMVPALEIIAEEARLRGASLTAGIFYFGTGLLSSILDNTPTYLNFFTAALGKFNLDAVNPKHVSFFESCEVTKYYLEAISVGAVFWGAMTYIGNGPNFMVKSISDQSGVKCPSFFGYVFKYALPILVPIFIIVWALFFSRAGESPDTLHKYCPEIEQHMRESGSPADTSSHEHGLLMPGTDTRTQGVTDDESFTVSNDRRHDFSMFGSRLARVYHRQPLECPVSGGAYLDHDGQAAFHARRPGDDHRFLA